MNPINWRYLLSAEVIMVNSDNIPTTFIIFTATQLERGKHIHSVFLSSREVKRVGSYDHAIEEREEEEH